MKKILVLFISILLSAGLFAQTKTEIKTSQLPKAALKYIKDNLPGATITKAFRVTENNTVNYGVVVDTKGSKHILAFDKDGKFISKGDKSTGTRKQEVTPVQDPNTDPPRK